jgi:hypothetical protein
VSLAGALACGGSPEAHGTGTSEGTATGDATTSVGPHATGSTSTSSAADSTSAAGDSDASSSTGVEWAETKYLIFAVQPDGDPQTPDDTVAGIVAKIQDAIGPVTLAPDRRLGFMIQLSAWRQPQEVIELWLDAAFAAARVHDLAVQISIESHYFWETRSDLYSDPQNVEWIDWDGTPHPARYLDWGAPERLAPHICYESAAIVAEVSRIGTDVIGAAMRTQLDGLGADGRADLFAGVTLTSEPALDDYAALDPTSALAQLMDADGAPRVQLGRCSLSRLGYSAEMPPADMDAALAEVNRRWVDRWSCALEDAGVPRELLYTHVAAGAALDEDGLAYTHAPLSVAFNQCARPGFTTYAVGALGSGLDAVVDAVQAADETAWGGTEGSLFVPPNGTVDAETYLRWHFDNGATVLVINSGATGELGALFDAANFSEEALSAYRSFLAGDL